MPELIRKTVKVDGKRVRYYKTRESSKLSKQPVVILHGFMSDATSLEDFASHLQVDAPIIIPDLPGFGESELADGPVNLNYYVAWLEKFLSELEVTPKIVIGYSFGAYISALYMAKYKRASKARLILITPVIKIDWKVRLYGHGFRFMAIRARRFAERLYLLQYDLTTRYLWKNRHPTTKTQLLERRREELAYLRPELVLQLFNEFLHLDLVKSASKIRQPTVIIMASNDNVAGDAGTRRFATMIKAPVTVVEIRHAGHLLPIEEPAMLATSLRGYLAAAADQPTV